MTVVKIANSSGGSDLEKNVFSPLERESDRDRNRNVYEKVKVCGGEVDTDQESNGSWSEDMDNSPRSVVARAARRWPAVKDTNVHSQILKIREEESHIGDGIGEGLSKDHHHHHHQHHHVTSHVDVAGFRRPILPASPLSGGKTTAVKMLH
ncbi:hypothetical protein LguiB_008905 [Lonicera macranthoides]